MHGVSNPSQCCLPVHVQHKLAHNHRAWVLTTNLLLLIPVLGVLWIHNLRPILHLIPTSGSFVDRQFEAPFAPHPHFWEFEMRRHNLRPILQLSVQDLEVHVLAAGSQELPMHTHDILYHLAAVTCSFVDVANMLPTPTGGPMLHLAVLCWAIASLSFWSCKPHTIQICSNLQICSFCL